MKTIGDFLKTRTMAQHAGLCMILAGFMAFVYQAWKNAKTATRFSEGSDVYIDAIGGIAPELFVAAAAIGIISLRNSGKLESGKSLAALMALCVGFGIFASFQQISVGRVVKAADNSLAAQNLAGRATELKRIEAELATMSKVPAVATANEALNRLKSRRGWTESNGCASPGSFTTLCRQVADARAVIGAAERKASIEARQIALSTTNETTRGANVSTADPAAEWLASVAGWQPKSAQMAIAGFMAVTMMLVGMFGVHFGLIVYGMDHAAAGETPKRTAEVVKMPARTVLPTAIAVAPPVFKAA